MYSYTDFDRQFVHARAAQFRDQLQRHLTGQLGEEEFRPLRLQNGWYVQRHAPMLRIAVPYGELSSRQLQAAGADRTPLRPRLRPLHDATEPAIQLDPVASGR